MIFNLQNVLGFSAVQTGVRLLALTGAIFATAGVAGRLSARVPTRLLIGPGFMLIGTGLLLMRGLTADSEWTHLLPGMIVAGLGAGLVNVPLASTTVGVVEPARAGMASGINATFRQVGIATGIAALGSIFARRGGQRTGLRGDRLGPAPARAAVAHATQLGFVDGLNTILLVGAIVAFAGAALALVLIRQRDYAPAEAEISGVPVPA